MTKGIKFYLKVLFSLIVLFITLFIFTKSAFASVDHLLINEIYPNSNTGGIEWIELYNPTESLVDLTNYAIEDETAKPESIKQFISILPNSYLVIEKGKDFSFGLNNDGDSVLLKNGADIIDQVTYGKLLENAKIPPKGKSITRLEGIDTDNDNADFIIVLPSSGEKYTKPIYSNDLSITEILPGPSNGSENEFIEIYNKGNQPVDLAGWELDDVEGGSSPHVISEDTIISPMSYLFFKNIETGIILNDDGDSARLIDPNEEIKSMISYDKAVRGQSYSLFDNKWQWMEKSTPGEKNQLVITKEDAVVVGIINIADAREKENGEDVMVTGIVTALPGVLSSQYFYIQDGTGGMQIYCYGKTFPTLTLGDSISVTGELSQTNNERRIKISGADKIVILNHTEPIKPAETSIADIGEKSEGMYIKTAGIVTETSGNTFHISDGQAKIKVVINKSTKIDKPKMKKGDQVEVTGIVSQYKDEYRILPIDQDDVKIIAAKGELPRAGKDQFIYPLISLFLLLLWNIFLKAKKKLIKLPPI
ncbi:MAG: lamin tail domain-containing protein [Patescibacteria group bacterium]|nr:lamin tail domain-containing protein [Patescibacteria group bacterium]